MQPICGYVVAAFKPATPPVFPTPDIVWRGLVASKVDFAFTVPAFIEVSIIPHGDTDDVLRCFLTSQEWGRDPAKVEVLKQMRGVVSYRVPLDKIP